MRSKASVAYFRKKTCHQIPYLLEVVLLIRILTSEGKNKKLSPEELGFLITKAMIET